MSYLMALSLELYVPLPFREGGLPVPRIDRTYHGVDVHMYQEWTRTTDKGRTRRLGGFASSLRDEESRLALGMPPT